MDVKVLIKKNDFNAITETRRLIQNQCLNLHLKIENLRSGRSMVNNYLSTYKIQYISNTRMRPLMVLIRFMVISFQTHLLKVRFFMELITQKTPISWEFLRL
ncbi:hypothetical protein FGO68_gene17139 [Halteria grandinella]|uniref:Uncharacterized protein n=1 Tax=Halteria grandinella TaxID=5974 RepID=A0A8J8NB52_HALGN|nr:hypothetical protein FGO68_gene17139 [Halteria grandinella]